MKSFVNMVDHILLFYLELYALSFGSHAAETDVFYD